MDAYLDNIIQHYGYDMKVLFEPFFVEINPRQDVVKLPGLFNNHYSSRIHGKVKLCDPAGNIHQVCVEVRYSEAYIVRGWNQVGRFYGLHNGGWARLVYVASDLFLATFRDRLDRPVSYPFPAKVCMLNQPPRLIEYPRDDLVPCHYADICKKPDMYHILEFELTHTDVTTGFLQIPLEFCQIAFRESGVKRVLVDEYGLYKTCVVDFHANFPQFCGITEGWEQFCTQKWFFEGLRVQLAVPVSNHNLISVVAIDA